MPDGGLRSIVRSGDQDRDYFRSPGCSARFLSARALSSRRDDHRSFEAGVPSQTRTVLSQLPEASRVPSGLKATPSTPPGNLLSCALSVRRAWPVVVSQTRTV